MIIYHMVGENMPHATGEAAVPHDAVVALLTALPFGFAAVFMLLNARHSAATGQPTSWAAVVRPVLQVLLSSMITGLIVDKMHSSGTWYLFLARHCTTKAACFRRSLQFLTQVLLCLTAGAVLKRLVKSGLKLAFDLSAAQQRS